MLPPPFLSIQRLKTKYRTFRPPLSIDGATRVVQMLERIHEREDSYAVWLLTCSPSYSPILINFPQNSRNLPPGITSRNRAESRCTGTRLKIVLTVRVQESGFEEEE
ncbi:hypothetical protein M422DRAFT_30991 [Sphaerobolus stellatus SS14]|uniref:Uncharacterized protein n=1 Tax=Sphaerobolus stellatus (strain SS14) TaxID=990650 RepID=A0A0C9V7S7_SPHS4|nr:hypothetical protein M422DRAFT_30991 [Sphaerobolus stellatus SS14]